MIQDVQDEAERQKHIVLEAGYDTASRIETSPKSLKRIIRNQL